MLQKEIEELKHQLANKLPGFAPLKLATPGSPIAPASPIQPKIDIELKRENESLRKELALEKGKVTSLQKGKKNVQLYL